MHLQANLRRTRMKYAGVVMSKLPDDYEERLAALEDLTLNEVAVLGLEGLDVRAIAEIFGRTRTKVHGRLELSG